MDIKAQVSMQVQVRGWSDIQDVQENLVVKLSGNWVMDNKLEDPGLKVKLRFLLRILLGYIHERVVTIKGFNQEDKLARTTMICDKSR